jgi:hypothetical protein
MPIEFVGRSFNALRQKNCFLGFDAFIDYITKPIATGKGEAARYFGNIEEYAEFLQEHKNKSFSIELEPPRVKIGGNNPIMSRILSRCGVQVVTAGPYGIPRPNPLFQPIFEQCKVISFSDPGICTAYEFSINKIMNYYNMNAGDFSYEHLLKYVSEEELVSIFDMMDLVVFVNIGEQPAVLNILEAIEERVLPKLYGQKKKPMIPHTCLTAAGCFTFLACSLPAPMIISVNIRLMDMRRASMDMILKRMNSKGPESKKKSLK